ncbi:MAG: hypothetical protein K2N73_18285 [Lachnospiraceae bacterium]|nr:hypothetical protein [Lachnospiraceae bacterium]
MQGGYWNGFFEEITPRYDEKSSALNGFTVLQMPYEAGVERRGTYI